VGTSRGSVPVAFNRKEAKAHGEGGVVIGAPLQGNVLIVDDVITAGTAIRESLSLIDAQGARAAGILIALDRQERGQDTRSAVQEIEAELGIPVIAIARLQDLLTLTGERAELLSHRDRLDAYRQRYAA
jgi:orotate phosphoribosyltransferase